MTSYEFVIWLRGFTEACPEFHPTPKQWDRLKEVLNEVEDYDDNPGIDVEIDDWYPKKTFSELNTTSSGSLTGSGSVFIITDGTGTSTNTVWNHKMGCWHYTNYPEGFGYYTNSTLGKTTPEETKKQLLD
jgi:hypothetical protein